MQIVSKPDDGPEPTEADVPRLGSTESFTGILLFLAELAPEPWATELYRIAQTGRRAA